MDIFSVLGILFDLSSRQAKRIFAWGLVISMLLSSHFFPQQYKKTSSAILNYYVEVKLKSFQPMIDGFTKNIQKQNISNGVR